MSLSKKFEEVGIDGLTVLHAAIDAFRRAAPCRRLASTAARWT
jgi:hypothetical protein